MDDWNSVKKNLPKKNGKYLCTIRVDSYKTVGERYFAKDLFLVSECVFADKKGKPGFYVYDSEWGVFEDRFVTAWMPMPEPYGGE